jgi:hypothetical protein
MVLDLDSMNNIIVVDFSRKTSKKIENIVFDKIASVLEPDDFQDFCLCIASGEKEGYENLDEDMQDIVDGYLDLLNKGE